MGRTAERRFAIQESGYTGVAALCDQRTEGFTTKLREDVIGSPDTRVLSQTQPAAIVAVWSPNPSANPLDLIRIYCRRDDYAFLPPNAQGGIPCGTIRTTASFDPQPVARQLFDTLSLPSLRLGMNPRLGLVAVPTWFWVEGYGGEMIPLNNSLDLPHQECTLDVERDGRGDVVLDGDGAPVIAPKCTTTTETIGVEVRAWPSAYHWDFGDHIGQTVACQDVGPCTAGLGRAYTDPRTPSPIQHAYGLSSLGQQGDSDAYNVQLAITFSAAYRFSRNGAIVQDWQSLPDRQLSWSTNHKVQEAQAVLTRP